MTAVPAMTVKGYRWLTRCIAPALWLWDAWRALRQPIYRPHRPQRWARALPAPLPMPLIWLHAVSVGETQACAPLLRALLARHPQHGVLLTHMTPTGRDTGAALFAHEINDQRVQQCYLPYDIAGLPERFLAHFQPVAGIIMETEVWPNLIAACHSAGVPVGLANARLSEQSLRKSLRMGSLATDSFNALAWVAAQSEADAQRLTLLRPDNSQAIVVVGNLKFDVQPDAAQLTLGAAFKAAQHSAHQRITIALASTREGEEALLLAALKPWLTEQPAQTAVQAAVQAEKLAAPLILLIPRHPKRAAALIALLAAQGLRYRQRSAGELPTADTQVYLCDTLGEMWFYYGASDIALVGGGWLPHGGQNLIEPCMAGCAVLVGPHMFNFAHAVQLAVAAQAVIQCDAPALPSQLAQLMDSVTRKALAERAHAFAGLHRGATAQHLALVQCN